MENDLIAEKQKEMCAVSNTYKAIFDFDTGIWKEGPMYFLSLYEEELKEV